jgi:hypothetical protein
MGWTYPPSAVRHVGASAPAQTYEGLLWVDTSSVMAPVMRVWLAGAWRTLSGGAAPDVGLVAELDQTAPMPTQTLAGQIGVPAGLLVGTLDQTAPMPTQTLAGTVPGGPSAGPTILTWEHTATPGNVSGTVTVDRPAGVTDGDLLLAVIVERNRRCQAPSGFTLEVENRTQDGGATTSSGRVAVYSRVASSEPSSYTFNLTNTTATVCYILRITPGADVVAAASRDQVSNSNVLPSMVAPAGGMLLYLGARRNIATTLAWPSSTTVLHQFSESSHTGGVGYEEDLPAGATGERSLVFGDPFNSVTGVAGVIIA